MVKRPFGDLQIVKNVLNRQALIAFGHDPSLRGIQDGITPRRMLCDVYCPSHRLLPIYY